MNPVVRVISGEPRRCAMLVVAAMALTVGLASAASASPFSNCPLSTKGLTACVHAETTGGEFIVGNTTVPISKPVILQGGIIEKVSENEAEELITTEEFIEATEGKTLSKTALEVPGGLAGLIKCNEISNFVLRLACEVIFQNGLTGVTATTELSTSTRPIEINEGNLVDEKGTALSLPVKIKLSNPLLGGNCYIGSNLHPVVLNLTTGKTSPPGPNTPIEGSAGHIKVVSGLLTDEGSSLVDNSFFAPGVEGCSLLPSIVDPLVDAKVELPATEGHNTARLDSTLLQESAKLAESE